MEMRAPLLYLYPVIVLQSTIQPIRIGKLFSYIRIYLFVSNPCDNKLQLNRQISTCHSDNNSQLKCYLIRARQQYVSFAAAAAYIDNSGGFLHIVFTMYVLLQLAKYCGCSANIRV